MSKTNVQHSPTGEPPQTLDLAHLDDAAFDKLYGGQIEQPLLAREAERQSDVSKFWLRLVPGCLAVVALAYAAISSEWYEIGWIGGVVGLGAVVSFSYWPLSTLYTQVKYRMLTTIADAIGCHYKSIGFETPAVPRMLELGLLPRYDRASYEDSFTGQRFKCAFDLFEANLEEKHQTKNGTSYSTVFRGQIVRVAFPKKFLGITIVRRDRGLFNFMNHFGNGKLQRVGLESSKFEHDFEVYASDQVEARELVHPVFMERLLALESHFDGRRIRCAFQDGDLLLAVEGRNRFELGSMFRPLADPARVGGVVNDIAEILRLIDSMLTSERAPLLALGNTDLPADA